MQALHRLRAGWVAMDPFRADLTLAIVAVVAAVLESALINHQDGSRVLTAVLASAMVGPAVALRRRDPLLAAASFVGGLAASAAFDTFVFTDLTTPFVILLLLCYSAGRHLAGRRFWASAAVLFAGAGLALTLGEAPEDALDILWLLFLITPPILAGRALRSRALLQAELREKAERAEAERSMRARRAVEEERTRIASELQAVVANSVSAMVVQAEAVPRVLDAGEAHRAQEAFELIEETGRDALAEMRRLLGVLRREGERPALAPQPGLAVVDALLQRVREGGLAVELRVEGERRPLAPGVDLTAYRLLQEGLEAAAAEASTAEVTLRYGERDLELEIVDDRPPASESGASIAALRERVGLYGGHVRVVHSDGAGHVLQARVPVAVAPAPAGSAP
jgi:signal transduction histidine kinase